MTKQKDMDYDFMSIKCDEHMTERETKGKDTPKTNNVMLFELSKVPSFSY